MNVIEMAAVLAAAGYHESPNHRPGSHAKQLWIREIDGPECSLNRRPAHLHVYLFEQFTRGGVVLPPTFDMEIAMTRPGFTAVLKLYGFSTELTRGLLAHAEAMAASALRAIVAADVPARDAMDVFLSGIPASTAARYAERPVRAENFGQVVIQAGEDDDGR